MTLRIFPLTAGGEAGGGPWTLSVAKLTRDGDAVRSGRLQVAQLFLRRVSGNCDSQL